MPSESKLAVPTVRVLHEYCRAKDESDRRAALIFAAKVLLALAGIRLAVRFLNGGVDLFWWWLTQRVER
ncbi:hypothetical protein PENNAL_c0048G02952 [Penicillium nalgiovense]|uniref:Uncharacterized protein n=1 Tax=Penicillium nalgiovense TaxID=60175 RepID=A0A1V6XYB6_PENNA|nr:hypothetical protein PENNAL_c0048G02952 [Penicillium nalgiovense]